MVRGYVEHESGVQAGPTNWAFLEDVIAKDVEVALLCEAAMRPQTFTIYGSSGTSGRDYQRAWSTAIVSKLGPVEIHDAVPVNYLGKPRKHLPFKSSGPELGPRRK